ncbi:hypothetical protein DSL72_000845 [Monilinia vaccinii-corymbosi]|uniref:Mid2 domain-containing protein n=1 Tax=Monilinia vaccinii-corymbosi TaxID=61207 RepID=A0A8A3P2N2_9HELO|nr:hypothetical protein DSL72_000845 [Monilinia vaccinii-corymbosi]
MRILRDLLLQSIALGVCRAEIVFRSPSMGEVIGPGPYKIRASDNGTVPTLGQFDDASWEVVLFTGNDTAPFELWEYRLSGYQMKDPTTQSPPVNIRKNVSLSLENKFFFGYRSYLTSNESIWITAYSDRFTLTNMNGTLPEDVAAANNNVSSTTAPKRTISCGAKAGGACDHKVLESLGLGAASQVDASTTRSKKMSGAAIAGIVVGVVAALSITTTAVIFFITRAKKRKMLRGEMIRNDMGQAGQDPGAFYEGDAYGGVMKKRGPEELESNRTYEMSAGHRLAEMPENP